MISNISPFWTKIAEIVAQLELNRVDPHSTKSSQLHRSTLPVIHQLKAFQRGLHTTSLQAQRLLPTGGRDWVLSLFAFMMVTVEGAFSEIGAAIVLAWLKETPVGLSFNSDGKRELIQVIDKMISSPEFHDSFNETVQIHDQLADLVKIDLGISRSSELSQQEIKIALLRALLWEERQIAEEDNCHFIASWILVKWTDPVRCYDYMRRCLENEGEMVDLVKGRLHVPKIVKLMISLQALSCYDWVGRFSEHSGWPILPFEDQTMTIEEGLAALFGQEAATEALSFLGARYFPALFRLATVYEEFLQMNPSILNTPEDHFYAHITQTELTVPEEYEPVEEVNFLFAKAVVETISSRMSFHHGKGKLKKTIAKNISYCVPGPISCLIKNKALKGVFKALANPHCLAQFDPNSKTLRPVMSGAEVINLIENWIDLTWQSGTQNEKRWLKQAKKKIRQLFFLPQLITHLAKYNLLMHPDQLARQRDRWILESLGGEASLVMTHCFQVSTKYLEGSYENLTELLEAMRKAQQIEGVVLISTFPQKKELGHCFTLSARDSKLNSQIPIEALVEQYITQPALRQLGRAIPSELLYLLMDDCFDIAASDERRNPSREITYGEISKIFQKNKQYDQKINHYFYFVDGKTLFPEQVVRKLAIECSQEVMRQMDVFWQSTQARWASVFSVAKAIELLFAQFLNEPISYWVILEALMEMADLPAMLFFGDSNYAYPGDNLEDPNYLHFAIGYDFFYDKLDSFEVSVGSLNSSPFSLPGTFEITSVETGTHN